MSSQYIKIKNVFFVFILFFSTVIHAQENLLFQQIGTQEGLPQNTVRTIHVDSDGFLWAGTLDGLVRYDGKRFINYKPRLGDDNQISDSRIRKIFEDKDGFLWIRKYDNTFNCYSKQLEEIIPFYYNDIKVQLPYQNYLETSTGNIWLWKYQEGCVKITKGDDLFPKIDFFVSKQSNTLTSYHVNFVYEDADSISWIGCSNGLNKIDKKGNITQLFKDDNQGEFIKILELENYVYFLTNKGAIYTYNKNKEIFLPRNVFKKEDNISNFIQFDKEYLLISTTTKRLLMYNINTGIYSSDVPFFKNKYVSTPNLIRDSKNAIWIFDQSGNVEYLSPDKKIYHSYELIRPKIATVIDDCRYNIFLDSKGIYWITTYGNGLYRYDAENEKLTNYSYQKGLNSLATDYLLSIAEDNVGNLWIGCEYTGIVKVSKDKLNYKKIKPEDFESPGTSNYVKVIHKDSNNKIWIGTKNGGLYVYDKELNNKVCVHESMNPYTILEDSKGRIWVGTKGGGIYVLDQHTYKQIYHFVHNENKSNSLCNNSIFDLIEDNKQRIWIASFSGGLDLFHESRTGVSFKHFFQDQGNLSYLRCLLQDKNGLMWVGSYIGLISFNPDDLIINSDLYTIYTYSPGHSVGLNSSDIKSLYQDSKGQLWIGTAGGGLNMFVKDSPDKQGEFKKYTKDQGLPSNIITSILESKDSVIWVSTENGLAHIDKSEDTFSTYRFTDEPYVNYYSENASLLCEDGIMLWGTLDGLIVFDPSEIRLNKDVPPVVLTDFYIFDQRIETYQKNSPLKQSISKAKEVTLKYEQRTFTLNFACLDLTDVDHNRYSYKMNNYDQYWSQPNTNSWATYKNMPPGEYEFMVKGANADGQWSDQITTCKFIVKPPLWKTVYALIIYFILFIVLTIVVIRFTIKINRLSSAVKMEKQLTDYKLRFFTNISHEFRTPLTLIKGAIERLNSIKKLPEEVDHNVKLLNRNTLQMSRLIDQLLEFRKLQNNVMTLNLEKTDIRSFALDVYYTFKDAAFQKNITYQFEGIKDAWEFYVDRNKVEKILFNLLSNAFKYTPAKGEIVFSINRDEISDNCIIEVKDTGIGIPKDKQELLFSRFMQINFSSEGTGVGLELVKEFTEAHKGTVSYTAHEGGGSIFSVELPTNNDIYEDARYIDAEKDAIAQTDEQKVHPEQEVKRPSVPHNWKILIVDDNYEIREYLSDELQHHFDIEVAVDGKEGLEKAIELNPTLIICDVKMPEMDGLEVTRRLKDNFETSHIPIILLTAMSSDTLKLQGSESGADAYIMKPFSMKYLLSRIYALIEQREKLKKRFSVDIEVKKATLSEATKDTAFYELINKIVDDNISNPEFSVADFTEKANLSRTIFYKKVKGLTGYSPNELIKVKRMKKAAELLLQGDYNVSEVSWKVGIEDPFYFSKCFKAQFGCAPSKYGVKEKL